MRPRRALRARRRFSVTLGVTLLVGALAGCKGGAPLVDASGGGLETGRSAEASAGREAAPPPRPSGRPQERPRVTFAGGVFLVVWQDFRSDRDYDVLGARVSAAGEVLDATPLRLGTGAGNQVLPEVASDGKGFLVVWQSGGHGFAARVGSDGAVSAPSDLGGAPDGPMPQAKIAWDGAHYLAAYGTQDLFTKRLTAEGKLLKPTGYGSRALRSSKDAVFSLSGVPGKGWLVISHRSPPDPWGWGGPGAARASLVLSSGELADKSVVEEPSGNWSKLPYWLDLGTKDLGTWPWGASASAWDGAQSVVVWTRWHLAGETKSALVNADLVASRVDGVKPLDGTPIVVAGSESNETAPGLASGGAGKLLCVYVKEQDRKLRVAARPLGTGGGAISVGAELLLLPGSPGGLQQTPHVAFGQDSYLVVWREGWQGIGGSARIYAARVSLDGAVLDAQGILLAPN